MTERVATLVEHPESAVIAVVGGTGAQGRGLAGRWSAAGHRVIIGSRDSQRAESAAASVGGGVVGATNLAAVDAASVVVLAVPWSAHEDTLRELQPSLVGRLVIDCVNPMGFDRLGPFPLVVQHGSAAEQAATLLPDAVVVGAFHHVSAERLLDERVTSMDGDVLVVGDDRQAVGVVIALANRIPGLRGIYAGRLRNAHQIEALTANLIAVNRRYKTLAGIRITGL